ncbi:MAG: hypothetical protein GY953_16680 [bacterium]|nr:hypothetical protein [bacterium]
MEPTTNSKPITFERNRAYLGGAGNAGVKVTAACDQDVLQALATNAPFPKRQIALGDISLAASLSRDITFGKGADKVSFSAKASAFSGLGVFPDPSGMLENLRPDENIAPAINFPTDTANHYVMLRWGYNLAGSAKGSVALGTGGGVTFGADGRKEGAFAVIRRLPRRTGARTALTETVNSWMLPRQVTDIDNLEPGTWIVAEVDGSVAASIGIQYGLDFNWVREAKLGGLTGDVGLRLQLGVNAALGFQASGRYAVVASRDSLKKADKVLRLRLYKLNKNGWNFAFNFGASANLDTSKFLPGQTDDFIKAVFGVHGAQIVNDLHAIEKWTNPNQKLSGALAGLTSKYVQKFIQDVTGVAPEAVFKTGRKKLLDLFKKWDALDHRASTLLWKFIEDKVDLGPVRDIAGRIANGTQDDAKALLKDRLENVDFFRTPAGRLLESLATGGLCAALTLAEHSEEFAGLQEGARLVSRILDQGETEKLLGNLQAAIEKRLNLDRVRQKVTATDFKKVDAWLRLKLASFLDERLNLEKLDEIRKTINLLLGKRQQFYTKALKALNRKYEFDFAYTYQRSTTKTALFDINFDFAKGNGTSDLLRAATNGDFDTVLTKPSPGVGLNVAELSHGINRQSSADLSMPYYKKSTKSITTSLAKLRATDDDSGRLLLYELDAKNKVESLVAGKSVRNSSLAVAGSWPTKLGNAVRVHNKEAISYSYSFRQAKRDMSVNEVEHQLGPYVASYFPKRFGATSRSFSNWISNLDFQIEQQEHNGIATFGDTLFGIDLSLPSEVASAWVNAPPKGSDRYLEMSVNLQTALKRLIPLYYFDDPKKYTKLAAAAPLLVYASIPAATSARANGGQVTLNKGKGTYWNWPDASLRREMASLTITRDNLKSSMRDIERLLLNTPGLEKKAKFYTPTNINCDKIISVTRGNQGSAKLESLLFVESTVIAEAVAAGHKMAQFRKKKKTQPAKAVAALSEFGEKITQAFNERIAGVYGGGALRPLGTLVFIEAAKALSDKPAIRKATPSAMLHLAVLKDGSAFKLKSFADNQLPAKCDLAIEERLVNLA